MVTRRVAEVMLSAAVRRWPVELREDLRREWSAELHVLATERRRLRMLGFAASLALRRNDGPLAGRRPVRGPVGRTAAALLLAPVVGVAIVLLSAIVMNVVVGQFLLTAVGWGTQAQMPLWTAMTAGLAVVLARFAARWGSRSALIGPLRTALGIMLPVGVVIVGIEYAMSAEGLVRAAPGLLSWLTFLTLVLWGASSLAGRGRIRAAWWFGVVGALLAADLAVVLTVVNQIPADPGTIVGGAPQFDTVDRVSAPLWLFVTWTDWSFGLPRPTPWEIFLITDVVVTEAVLYLAVTPYALAYVISAARSSRDEPGTARPPRASIA
ncbi:hypothetical protein [Micromonospora sp. NPDC023737]|uniref:hypothetical protein n=1 Tax=unclassified Micromonospora TaxID=2617518 RepID=UPI0033F98AEC